MKWFVKDVGPVPLPVHRPAPSSSVSQANRSMLKLKRPCPPKGHCKMQIVNCKLKTEKNKIRTILNFTFCTLHFSFWLKGIFSWQRSLDRRLLLFYAPGELMPPLTWLGSVECSIQHRSGSSEWCAQGRYRPIISWRPCRQGPMAFLWLADVLANVITSLVMSWLIKG